MLIVWFFWGLGLRSQATLRRYSQGQPLNNTRDLLDRVGHLLGIYKNLKLLYPINPEIREAWMSSRNRAFHGMTPVEVVRQYGFTDLVMVRARLDRMLYH